MKKITIFLFALLIQATASAHYLWVETAPVAQLNEAHIVKVKYGEYTYGAIETVGNDAFNSVKNFKLWLVSPSGKKTELKTTPEQNFYKASFIPTEEGSYTLALDNNDIQVLDYTEYDFGIFKPQYHAKARVTVGGNAESIAITNREGIEIINLSDKISSHNSEVKLKVLFQGEILEEQEVVIYVSDRWSKKMITDEKGEISFKLPWNNTLYTVETTFNENIPGTYNGDDYDFIWHCATYAIAL